MLLEVKPTQRCCEEAPDALFFTIELVKPFLLLSFGRIAVIAIIYQINIMLFISDMFYILVFFLLIIYVYGKFVRYGIRGSEFYIAFHIINLFGLKYRHVMFAKSSNQIEYFTVTKYSRRNASVSFKSRTSEVDPSKEGRSFEAPILTRRGMAWVFFTMPIRFGFYGIKNDGCISSYFSKSTKLAS